MLRSLLVRLPIVVGLGLVGLVASAAEARAQGDASIPVARVKYDGGGDWYSDEESLRELFAFARQHTLLDVTPQEEAVELTTDKLFTFPYLYLTGHGNVTFSETEADRLRRYLRQGGFLHIDDNYGLDEHIRPELEKVFPDKKLVEVPFDHSIYTTPYDFSDGLPKIHEHDGEAPKGYGYFDDHGRLMVFYTVETDLGDGWEPAPVHSNPPEKRRAALRMGTNILVYAMTH
ncbi:hypothetical protein GGP57_002699 [Salinibacter ruber]|uniref:DUF4159 domain-containing protein n=1 Tax=Salinibacter ruber TaxID=146919 RepID=A0A9X2TBK6_9BACT|nr:DUF4159 domain-containing protein [Salinibacter ruber]MBB4091073.1 hypothetical protein [Salinibacter ruber]MCS3611422.1 hypothetical protein [Salinibacter ruber]MCS3615527.1 hypothetical protein [Salinibacter ruber]MCS3635364.1 hypothetical protein [Salinibacter ruber]MCS3641113.1 hypothetical protein [Salinibacter ruber]